MDDRLSVSINLQIILRDLKRYSCSSRLLSLKLRVLRRILATENNSTYDKTQGRQYIVFDSFLCVLFGDGSYLSPSPYHLRACPHFVLDSDKERYGGASAFSRECGGQA